MIGFCFSLIAREEDDISSKELNTKSCNHIYGAIHRPINPFSIIVPILYPLKISENLNLLQRQDIFKLYVSTSSYELIEISQIWKTLHYRAPGNHLVKIV